MFHMNTEVNKSSMHNVKNKRYEVLRTHTDDESSLSTDLLRTIFIISVSKY